MRALPRCSRFAVRNVLVRESDHVAHRATATVSSVAAEGKGLRPESIPRR